jgi:splicing factor 3A subunit 1
MAQVLERAVHRHEWQKEEEDKKKSEKAEMEAEKVAYQAVDWHDFVVRGFSYFLIQNFLVSE